MESFINMKNLGVVAAASFALSFIALTTSHAYTLLTDDQVRAAIIQESRNAYYATGHPCACPYDHARNGSMCGGRSARSRPGGYEPKCFPQDVTAADISAYRASHGR